MMLTKTVFGCAVLLMAAAPALAEDGPIASARPVDTTEVQIRQYLDAASTTPADGEGEAAPLPTDRKPHGEFGVGIGTNGYREAYASTVVPVGEAGTAAIAVRDARINGRFGAQKHQSLSLALALGEGARPAAACPREGSTKAPEPIWVARMRADPLASTSAGCAPRR